MHRLVDLCLEEVVKHLDAVESLEALPDEILQKLLVLARRDKKFTDYRHLFKDCKLTKLDLHYQEQDGEGAEVLAWLDITHGDIQHYVQHLDVSGTRVITDTDIEGLQHLQQLSQLNLSECIQLTGAGLSKLHQLPLQRIVLEGCRRLNMVDTLTQLAYFTSLTSLNLSSCDLTDKVLPGICELKNLVFLDLSANKLLTGAALEHVGHLIKLRELILTHCRGAMAGLSHLKTLTNLLSLSLNYCEVNDEDIRHIEKLTQLECLTMIASRITDKGALSLGLLTNLTVLDMSMCSGITDKGVEPLLRLSKIKNLNLNYCGHLSDGGVATLTSGLGCLTSLGIIGCSRLLIQANHRPLALLAEDDPMQAKLIKMVLTRHNFDVEIACNGLMALDMYKNNSDYEIIVMDILMPIMDGLTATMRIRSYEREFGLKRTPIIMQTADAGKSHRQICLDAGCDDFMTKPLDKSLIEKASRLIETYNDRR